MAEVLGAQPGVDEQTSHVHHYGRKVDDTGKKLAGTYWTSFDTRNVDDAAIATHRTPAEMVYKYSVEVVEKRLEQYFKNVGTIWIGNKHYGEEYTSKIPISTAFMSVYMM